MSSARCWRHTCTQRKRPASHGGSKKKGIRLLIISRTPCGRLRGSHQPNAPDIFTVSGAKARVTVDGESVPQELRDSRQFVVWRSERRNGRLSKTPYSPARRGMASSTDPATWGTMSEALSAYQEGSGRYTGIGFVFSQDDPYCGVDLDDCVDCQERIAPWAAEIVKSLESYTEVSPSGNGVKIFLRGKKSGSRCRIQIEDGGIEMYDHKRFFALTGQHVEGTPAQIEDRQTQLDDLYKNLFGHPNKVPFHRSPTTAQSVLDDDAVVDKAQSAANGVKFTRLWGGDIEGYGSQSEADLALCGILAFWTRNVDQIDRLFRQSGLYRGKWDERRGAQTYGEMTIATAHAACTKHYEADHGDANAEKTRPMPELPEFPGPLGLSLKAITARLVGSHGKFEVQLHVSIDSKEQAPITITTAPSSVQTQARTLMDWIEVAKDAKLSDADRVKVRQFVEQLMGKSEEIHRKVKKHEKANPRARSNVGPIMQQIVIRNAPMLAGLTFKNLDGTIWSETQARNIDFREFERTLSEDLIRACEGASDYPEQHLGKSTPIHKIRQYLPVAWTEALKRLPGEVMAKTGPDSAAARRYADQIIRLFTIRERWRKVFRADASEHSWDSATLARLARDKIDNRDPTKSTGWSRCHNDAIFAWVCFVPILGPDGEPTGEAPAVWLAMRYELVNQLPKHSRPELPNTRNQNELSRIASRYALSAEGAPNAPSPWARDRTGKPARLLVLSRRLTDRILFHHDTDEDPEDVMKRECATASFSTAQDQA